MRISILLISLFSILLAGAQEVVTRLDTNAILIGEQTTYRIRLSGIEDPTAVKWPSFKDTLHSKIEIIETPPLDTLEADKLFTMEQRVIITSWDSGYYPIRPFDLDVNGKNLRTEALLLAVNTVEVDTSAAPMDIKPIYQEPFSLKDWFKLNWPYLLGVAVLLLLVWLILRMKRKGSVDVFGPAPVRIIPAHEKAWARLDKLKTETAFQAQDKKTYYSELTDTLRAYLEDRYRVKALEQTSAEILEGVRYVGMSAQDIEYLRALLRTADMVKFAKERPSDAVAEQHLSQAFEFVEHTKAEEVESDSITGNNTTEHE